MKKYVIMSLALMISSLSFSQKKEIKILEKAIKSANFSNAKASLQAAENLISAMDDKTKAKFYFLKGKALYANGSGTDEDVSNSIAAFDQVTNLEKTIGKFTYTSQMTEIKRNMVSTLYSKGETALKQKDFINASSSFDKAYRISKDTIYLYNAALLSQNAKDYDTTLKIYDELLDLGYTGIVTEYFATEITSGEEQAFPNKQLRDVSIKSKTFIKPRDSKKSSKVAEITKNVALIYVEQGQNDKAIEAINKAKALNPNDYNLLVSEANIRYKIGEKDKYKELIQRAVELQPDNVNLIFNLGVVSAENEDYKTAQEYYDKALAIDPNYVSALIASSGLIVSQSGAIVDQMNELGNSKADNKKFEELRDKRTRLYLDAIPYLEKALEIDAKNLDAAKSLMSLYSAIDDTEKFKAMKAKVEALEAGN